jgi:phosphoribosyl-AMP cyclohydrolase
LFEKAGWAGAVAILRSDIRRARLSAGLFFLSMDEILDFDKQGGLITAVVQDANTHRVLMVGYMNREALDATLKTGHVTFFSRSRGELWTKGGSSGHYLNLKSIATDCDGDALLVEAEPIGPGVCHDGYYSCFYRTLESGGWIENEDKVYDPEAVYGAKK